MYDFLLQIFLARLNSFSHSLEYIAESRSNNQKARRIIYCLPKIAINISLMILSSLFLCTTALTHITVDMILLFISDRRSNNNFFDSWTGPYTQTRADLSRNEREIFDSTIFSAPIRFINTYHAVSVYFTQTRERNIGCGHFNTTNNAHRHYTATTEHHSPEHNADLLGKNRNHFSSASTSATRPLRPATTEHHSPEHNADLLGKNRNLFSSASTSATRPLRPATTEYHSPEYNADLLGKNRNLFSSASTSKNQYDEQKKRLKKISRNK